ncbi:MAG: DUF3365 domain-containing protein [Chroococcidiopsidaceae cyanobacterium CP_BM_ER_R8_30]|nr:DUF3365 domain-containing protein [Chroococcidiopsidaceae cyanobacterium CP_BM_ER_R8_30]
MLKKLKLEAKFTLLLTLVFLTGFVFSGVALSSAMQQKAEDEIKTKAEILTQTMNSIRDYTSNKIDPLLKDRLETEQKFIPEFVPTHAVREVFEQFRKHPEYSSFLYKEASLNPTNPQDQADEFETKLVEQFRSQPGLSKLSGYRNIKGQNLFFIAQPLKVDKPSCLECHSTPALAPKSLLSTYGDKNGFGWKFQEVIAAQTVFVPADNVLAHSRQYLTLIMGFFITIFGVMVLLIHWLLKQAVILPIKQLTALAHKISSVMSASEQVGFDSSWISKLARRADEPGQLARAFQQIARQTAAREQNISQAVNNIPPNKLEFDS